MNIPRALMVIALIVAASGIMIMVTAAHSGSLATRLALTEPAAGTVPAPDSGADVDRAP
ncbi:MAG: hypothetical protein H6862_01790 [Rhodospirillales bacterium]|nr:hypothetical protein [Rhodospirillales bacterium]